MVPVAHGVEASVGGGGPSSIRWVLTSGAGCYDLTYGSAQKAHFDLYKHIADELNFPVEFAERSGKWDTGEEWALMELWCPWEETLDQPSFGWSVPCCILEVITVLTQVIRYVYEYCLV